MSFTEILYSSKNRVATITLNRPDKLNAWTATMEREVREALLCATENDDDRIIVLTGAGRGFCAGADMSLLSGLAAAPHAEPQRMEGAEEAVAGARPELYRKYAWFLSVPKPILAAINGHAVGLGFVIPLYCDLRVAAASARFNVIFSRRGLVAEYGMAWLLPRIVGLAHATDLMLTSRTIDGAEAARIGLVSRLLPDENFAAAVQDWAEEIADSLSPRSLHVMKRQIWDAQFQTFAEAYDSSLAEMSASLVSEDFQEGVRHHIENRAPRFSGR